MQESSIKRPSLEWKERVVPVSTEFDDVYFSTDSGLEEARYVFIENSQLPQRWLDFTQDEFTVFETGFGSALNFIATWYAWQQTKTKSMPLKRLHYVSVEKYPLQATDINRVLSNWPEFSDYKNRLLNQYPDFIPGCHRLHFDDVTLTLFFGSADNALNQFDGTVDAWYLDGFTPSKNPAMWSDFLFKKMSQHSANNASVATFTAASSVRRRLIGAGFNVQSAKGFGKKREMLGGRFTGHIGPRQAPNHRPWFWRPVFQSTPKKVAIIGAGIAGCSTANAVANCGAEVHVFEKDVIANGASGNLQGVLYAKLAVDLNKHTRFYLSGYQYTLNTLKRLENSHPPPLWKQTGVIQLGLNDKERERQKKFLANTLLPKTFVKGVSQEEGSNIAGTTLPSSGLYFPKGGWINPPSFCQALIDHPNIHLHERTEVHIEPKGERWQLIVNSQLANEDLSPSPIGAKPAQVDTKETLPPSEFDAVVICSANDAQNLLPEVIPTKPVRGQVSHQDLPTSSELKAVVCGKGYVSPSHPFNQTEQISFGATFDLHSMDTAISDEGHKKNRAMLEEQVPDIDQEVERSQKQNFNQSGRVGFRCTTPDYIPIVGPVAQLQQFETHYPRLVDKADWPYTISSPYHNSLYVNIGHGSRGLISAPISGEIIASYLFNRAMPIERDLTEALHPSRFYVRDMIRRNKNQ